MQNYPNLKFPKAKWPKKLLQIPQVPKELYIRGLFPTIQSITSTNGADCQSSGKCIRPTSPDLKFLCVVGSRRYSAYGEQVCQDLIKGLAGHPVVIVSGLAYGIDSIAHKCALDAKLPTIAIPGSGLDDSVIYPQPHLGLAHQILEKGGCLLSEYPQYMHTQRWVFPRRNRIMVGLSDAVLIIEGEQKSGTMISARLGTEYNRDVLSVPGSIYSSHSDGPNSLLRLGATPVTSSEDILEALHLLA